MEDSREYPKHVYKGTVAKFDTKEVHSKEEEEQAAKEGFGDHPGLRVSKPSGKF